MQTIRIEREFSGTGNRTAFYLLPLTLWKILYKLQLQKSCSFWFLQVNYIANDITQQKNEARDGKRLWAFFK
jgi:hypothetical protein